MEDKIVAKFASKKRSGSATQKGKDDVFELQDVETNDDMKLETLKDKVIRKIAISKSKRGKFTKKINQPRNTVMNVKGQKNLELKSEKAKIKGKSTLEKKSMPSSEIEISGVGSPPEAKDVDGNKECMETPWKHRRGADSEITQTYLSSADTIMSRFRPRKEVPAFRVVDLDERDWFRIVGKRVKVYWPGSRRWFIGRIKSFDNNKKHHSILYEDGDKEDLELSKERFELEILPSEGFTLRIESKFRKRVAALEDHLASGKCVQEESAFSDDAKNASERPEVMMKTAVKAVFGRKWTSEVKAQKAEMRFGKSVADMDVDIHSELDELLCHELLDTKDHTLVAPGKEDDGSESTADMLKEVIVVKEAQTGEFHSGGKAVCLDDRIGSSGKSVVTLTYTRRRGAIIPVKKPTNLRENSSSEIEIKSGLKLLNREVSHNEEQEHAGVDEDMKHNEVNMKYVHCDIHVEKDVMCDLEKENDKAFPFFTGKSEEIVPVSLTAQGSPSCGNPEDMQKKQLAVPPGADGKEKAVNEEINIEVPMDAISSKNNDGVSFKLKIVNEESDKGLLNVQSTSLAKFDEGNSIIQQEKPSVVEAEYVSKKEIILPRPESRS